MKYIAEIQISVLELGSSSRESRNISVEGNKEDLAKKFLQLAEEFGAFTKTPEQEAGEQFFKLVVEGKATWNDFPHFLSQMMMARARQEFPDMPEEDLQQAMGMLKQDNPQVFGSLPWEKGRDRP
jgi:hypothetical protein